MCELMNKLEENERSGYKIAIKYKDKYYSPATGLEIKVGKVKATSKVKKLSNYSLWLSDGISDRIADSSWYCKEMYGRSSIFIDLSDAKCAGNSGNDIVILRCTIKNDLMNGILCSYDGDMTVIAGRYIVSFEEIKYL